MCAGKEQLARLWRWLAIGLGVGVVGPRALVAATRGAASQARLAADAKAGRPLVVHVVVALCDNEHQGIVRVPKHLGNGQDPKGNLYWGARYGLKTYFVRDAGWRLVRDEAEPGDGVLERVVLTRRVSRAGAGEAVAYLVAEAWDGRQIRDAISRFVRLAAGHDAEWVSITENGRAVKLSAGGSAHVVAYVGHNGLMEFPAPAPPPPPARAAARSAIVLACASRRYFAGPLKTCGAHGLVLTTGFMAPEAYTLSAVLRTWLAGGTPPQAREAAARAYHRYQKCGLAGARRLFWGEP